MTRPRWVVGSDRHGRPSRLEKQKALVRDAVTRTGSGETMVGVDEEPANWSMRYKQNVALLKSGDTENAALVAERLLRRRREKGISGGEFRMLCRALQIVELEFRWRREQGGDHGGVV